jgi:HSP90 family molecular chaperone
MEKKVEQMTKAELIEYAKRLESDHERDSHLAETVNSKDAEILRLKQSIKDEIEVKVKAVKEEAQKKIDKLVLEKEANDAEILKEYKRLREESEAKQKTIADSFEQRLKEKQAEVEAYKAALARRSDELEQGLYQFDAFIKGVQGAAEMAVELRGLLNEKITRK